MRGRAAGSTRERALERRGFRCIAGIDEVGRGCLAGPVVAAAVVLHPERPVRGLRDSKLLTARERERLAAEIRRKAVATSIGEAEAPEIDAVNILRATLLAMRRAVERLPVGPDYLLVDALRIPGVDVPQEGIVHGDRLVGSIAAASIIAKVHRDALMLSLDKEHPGYGFDRHKGYGTPRHFDALQRLGPCPQHRTTFRGVPPAPTRPLPSSAPQGG